MSGTIDTSDRGKYKVLRAQFREQAWARRDVCFFCDGAIDYRVP